MSQPVVEKMCTFEKNHMSRILALFGLFIGLQIVTFSQTPLNIPPVLSGSEINLDLQEGTTEFYPSVVTNTMGANGSLLGPTMILHRDSAVTINVTNNLPEETTIHWHGMHVAPENDGGPHSVISAGDTWSPSFTVMDKAGANWYHPHLHMKTNEHVSKGIAGLILVRDEEEAGLNLPLTYGVDEFPLVLQTKAFDASGQILPESNLDTSVMVNGTINATLEMPEQVVRLRILNGSTQRIMEIGFSDDRSFSIIGTDGGLLAAPVTETRYRMGPGQRVDILLDLGGDIGQNFQLMSFASELPNGYYGAAQPGMGPGATASLTNYTSNPLNGGDYSFLDITVVAATASPITAIPATLASFTPLVESSADITRTLTFTSAGGMGDLNGPFNINGSLFDMDVINYFVPLDNVEIWELQNNTPISHPFHIHDVQFFILDINGNPPPPEMAGYNDVVIVPSGMSTVRFIAEFNDFTNETIPYMYHCHMLTHEDDGMMGQFLVLPPGSGIDEESTTDEISIYPNPTHGNFQIDLGEETNAVITLTDLSGKIVMTKSCTNQSQVLIEQDFPTGVYLVKVATDGTTLIKRLVIN